MDFGKLMEQASRMQESLGRLEDELNETWNVLKFIFLKK